MPVVAAKLARTDAGLASTLRVSVMRLSRRLRNERDAADDLTPTHLAVLATLTRRGKLTIGELAAAEKVQPPSMTRTVNALCEKGLLVRRAHPDDKRLVVVELTDDARSVIDESRRRKEAWLNQRLDELTPAERRTLRDAAPILERLFPRMSPTFQALTVRNFRLYTMGGVVSNTGTWMQRVAQDWLVLELTHSGTALGITTALQFLPFLLVTPYAGLVADRSSKRRLLAMTQLSLAASAGILGLLAVTGMVQVWQVFVLAFIFGIGTAFDAPARQSFVVEMVGRDFLPNAVGLNSASFNIGRIVGPGLAGLLIAALGSGPEATGWVILLNAVSYLAVVFSLRAMRAAELAPSIPLARAKGALRDGVRYVLARPDLIFVFVVAFAAGTFGLNFQMTTALMATGEFHKGAGEFGLLGSMMAIGSLTGALLSARRGYPRRAVLVLAAVAFALAEIAAGLMPTYWTFALWLPVVGISALTLLNSLQTVVQLSVDAEIRGRIVALYMMILMGGTPFGAPVIGWVGETFGPRWTLVGGGVATLLVVLGATGWLMRKEHLHLSDVSIRPAPSRVLV